MSFLDADPELSKRMEQLGLREEDFEESFVRGTGPGGQKINKTSSTVQIKHLPTGIEIRCQRERQQAANRIWARYELCEKIEELRQAEKLEKQNAKEKKRRQNRKRPRGVKEKILKGKHQRSDLKKQRGRVRSE